MKKTELTAFLFAIGTLTVSSLDSHAADNGPVFCKIKARDQETVVDLRDFAKVGSYKDLGLYIYSEDNRAFKSRKHLAILRSVFGTFLVLEFTDKNGKKRHDIFESTQLDDKTLVIRKQDSAAYEGDTFSVRCENHASKLDAEKLIDLAKLQKRFTEELKNAHAEHQALTPAKSGGADKTSMEAVN